VDILIQAEQLRVAFQHHVALDNVGLTVHQGQIVTLLGPNGAGKSTLVRVVLGLLTPQSGQVWRRAGMRIGYMPQRVSIDPILPLTVKRFLTLSRITDASRLQPVLAEVGISHLLNRPLQHISGGEMQRVLLARALLPQPELLVLDEPIQGVDVNGQYELYQLINQIRQRHGCGILMVSHELHLVMAATDLVLCLNQQVCCSGPPATVSQHPAYLHLFGKQAAQELAVYTHHHH